MKKIISIITSLIGILLIIVSVSLTLNKNVNDTKANDKLANIKEYILERVYFYKELDGKIVDFDENVESYAVFKFKIDTSDYKVERVEDQDYEITFIEKNNDYRLIVSIENGKYLTLKDIEDDYKSKFVFIDIDSNYKVGDKTVVKAEYQAGENNYLEYMYLFKNGSYIKFSFVGNKDYKFNHKELEKLLNFNIKDKTDK